MIKKREGFGDWEADLMYFQGRAILTLVKKKSRFTITSHLVNTYAQTINNEISRIIIESGFCYGKVAKRLRFNTITFDIRLGDKIHNYLEHQQTMQNSELLRGQHDEFVKWASAMLFVK